jgi:hypothetical protein
VKKGRAKNGKKRKEKRGRVAEMEGNLEVVVLDLEAGEEDERDDRRHDAAAAGRRRVLHRGGAWGWTGPASSQLPSLLEVEEEG